MSGCLLSLSSCTEWSNLPSPIHVSFPYTYKKENFSSIRPTEHHLAESLRDFEMANIAQVVVSLTALQLTGNSALVMASALMMLLSIADR